MYINTETMQYPISETDIRVANPTISLPAVLVAPAPYAVVFDYPRPSCNPLSESVQEIAPALAVNGHWEQRWTIVALPQTSIDANVAAAKLARWGAIKAERDRRKGSGYTTGGKWYHSDDGSRIQQLGLLMMGANIPSGLQWKTLDGTFVTMTQTLAAQIFQAAATSDMTIFAKAEWHRAQMEASATPNTYDFSAGWPLIYGE